MKVCDQKKGIPVQAEAEIKIIAFEGNLYHITTDSFECFISKDILLWEKDRLRDIYRGKPPFGRRPYKQSWRAAQNLMDSLSLWLDDSVPPAQKPPLKAFYHGVIVESTLKPESFMLFKTLSFGEFTAAVFGKFSSQALSVTLANSKPENFRFTPIDIPLRIPARLINTGGANVRGKPEIYFDNAFSEKASFPVNIGPS